MSISLYRTKSMNDLTCFTNVVKPKLAVRKHDNDIIQQINKIRVTRNQIFRDSVTSDRFYNAAIKLFAKLIISTKSLTYKEIFSCWELFNDEHFFIIDVMENSSLKILTIAIERLLYLSKKMAIKKMKGCYSPSRTRFKHRSVSLLQTHLRDSKRLPLNSLKKILHACDERLSSSICNARSLCLVECDVVEIREWVV